ncbi:hypothetical protein FGB62_104g115 [Gracilaria domingensis]|nr:hypothetical protein FGB62_104g115 [Gracilaria domingensis]
MLSNVRFRRLSSLSESQIIHLFRTGDFDAAIRHFVKRPAELRSDNLYEVVVRACAQVPDSVAASAVFNSMSKPTQAAAAHVVSALCRERNAHAAFHFLQILPSMGLAVDRRFVSAVSRAAPNDRSLLTNLRALRAVRTKQPPSSASPFFLQEGIIMSDKQPLPPRTRRYAAQVAEMEHALCAAVPNIDNVERQWSRAQKEEPLQSDTAVLSAAISAFVACGGEGAVRAIHALMSWVRANLCEQDYGTPKSTYTSNPSAMALLLTSATKAIAAASSVVPSVCLSAYDNLTSLNIPLFESSLPLTGAYFKLLQHAALSLDETQQRIEHARRRHVQLDEQAFSMALGAILRCNARLNDRLAAGKAWMDTMRSACIPLKVHTYNLFAGQLRYCNDPEMVTTLLSDMTETEIVPTAVTYGLIFSACVIPGDYRSARRKQALPVTRWQQELSMMEEHMIRAGVRHTPYSRLSLARAYAHLGIKSRALEEFGAYLRSSKSASSKRSVVSRMEIEDAFDQMIYNFANCRECRPDGPKTAIHLYEEMSEYQIPPSGHTLDSLLAAYVRMGDTHSAIDCAKKFVYHGSMTLSQTGIIHLLEAIAELQDSEAWWSVRNLCVDNKELLISPELRPNVKEFIIRFARRQQREVCNDMMSIADIEVSDLDFIFKKKEFLRFRTQMSRRVHQQQEEAGVNGLVRTTVTTDTRQCEQTKANSTSKRSRTLHGNSLVPL